MSAITQMRYRGLKAYLCVWSPNARFVSMAMLFANPASSNFPHIQLVWKHSIVEVNNVSEADRQTGVESREGSSLRWAAAARRSRTGEKLTYAQTTAEVANLQLEDCSLANLAVA